MPRSLSTMFLRLFDPAGAYFVKVEHDSRKAEGLGATPEGPPHWQAGIYGSGSPDGSRPANADDRKWFDRSHDECLASYHAREEAWVQRWRPILREAVQELLKEGVVTVVLGGQTIEARIIRFWRGNSLLATTSSGPKGGGESLSRISRNPRRERPGVLLDYLVRAALEG